MYQETLSELAIMTDHNNWKKDETKKINQQFYNKYCKILKNIITEQQQMQVINDTKTTIYSQHRHTKPEIKIIGRYKGCDHQLTDTEEDIEK